MAVSNTSIPPDQLDKLPHLGMVGWFDPPQLLRTGVEVIVSTLFGRHSDGRRLDAVSSECPVIDYRKEESLDEHGCFRFDYIADSGDGWNSTYAVAYTLSHAQWKPTNHEPLPRGQLLVMGGDLVYPYPTRSLYETRLLAPYAIAGRLHDDPIEVLAIPGNHDWYDSLVNFRRVFCSQRLNEFRTRQTRSYFAARLPANWWLFGVDVQLDHDIDDAQYKFFCELAEKLEDDEQVILCIPEPVWQKRWEHRDGSGMFTTTLLDELEARLGSRIRLCIAGDSHHYQRFSTADGDRHRVTCGTGGAFLHPTHEAPQDPSGEFQHQCSFPSQEESRRLTRRNMLFAWRNPWFGLVPAIVYLLAAWQSGLAVGECFHGGVCISEIGTLGLGHWREVVVAGMHSALLSPTGMALYAVTFWGFVFFADRRSRKFRYTIGTLHALAHIVVGFLVYWAAVYLAITTWGLTPKSIPQYVVSGTLIVALSWIAGSIVLGLYLLVSLNRFGMHRNEAFSAMRVQDWKGFLRFTIDQSGTLQMRFIGLPKVPRSWTPRTLPNGLTIWDPAKKEAFQANVCDAIDIGPRRVAHYEIVRRDATPANTQSAG
jgi:hypothetical protein